MSRLPRPWHVFARSCAKSAKRFLEAHLDASAISMFMVSAIHALIRYEVDARHAKSPTTLA